jgi:hypothetical protein
MIYSSCYSYEVEHVREVHGSLSATAYSTADFGVLSDISVSEQDTEMFELVY